MYPDFLCIGAQKAGTMWLYQNLARHPQVAMPPIKEMHYFNRPSLPVTEPFWTNIGCVRGARRVLLEELASFGWTRNTRRLRWALRFLFVPRSDSWYRNLFDNGAGRIAGDMTPGYAKLDNAAVARAYQLMPRAKIIYILRNPIRRSWSQAVKHFRQIGASRFRDLRDLPDETILGCFALPTVVRNSAYSQTIDTWGAHFPSSQILICFFDDIVENPRKLLRDCFRFLEIDSSDSCISILAEERFNAESYNAVPERFHSYLADLYYPEICRLNQRFQNRHTLEWLDECERSRSVRLGQFRETA